MRRWKPLVLFGRWYAVGLLVLTLAALVFPILQIIQAFATPPENWQIDLQLFGWWCLALLLIVAAAWLGYRVVATFTLAYELDRNGLYISWAGHRAIIPLDQISNLDIGIELERMPFGILQQIGAYWGRAWAADQHSVQLFSTLNPARGLVVHTANESYVISPTDPDSFVQDLEQRRNLGSTKQLSLLIEPGNTLLGRFWYDAIVRWLLGIALMLNLLALAMLSLRYPQLATMLEMRFDAIGQVAELRPKYQLLFMPLAAFGLTLVNLGLGMLLYARQLLGARLLQGASLMVQILFAIALITITR
jgi:hypothetical protein